MAHYLVTGCAGFIGARTCALLLEQGHHVTGVDNLCANYDVRLKQWRLDTLLEQPNFYFHQRDITDLDEVEGVFLDQKGNFGAPFDAVINLAARAGVRFSVDDPWTFTKVNSAGNLNLLEACRAFGVGKYVLASTSSLYGVHNPMPFREDANTDKPFSPYAASKKAAEVMCYTYHHLYGLDCTVFRYFTVYGPAGRPDMSPLRFTKWIFEGQPLHLFGDGSFTRDFTYVDDIARGTILGLKPVGYEVINLGCDTPRPMIEFIRLLEERIGQQANIIYHPVQAADLPATWAEISKARALLGWQPEVTLEEGLTRLVEWYRANRAWTSQIPLP